MNALYLTIDSFGRFVVAELDDRAVVVRATVPLTSIDHPDFFGPKGELPEAQSPIEQRFLQVPRWPSPKFLGPLTFVRVLFP